MKTVMAFLLVATSAWAQDRPKDGDLPRSEGPRDGDTPRPPGGRAGVNPRPPGPREGDQSRPPGAPDGDFPRPPGAPGAERPPLPRDGGRRPVPPFNPEEVTGWLKENEPDTFRRLSQAQDDGKWEDVQRLLSGASLRMRDLAELKQRDPKGYERIQELRRLEREGMNLADQARRAGPDDKDSASKKLQENLSRQFDLREEQRIREIAELKRRVDMLEKSLSDRKAVKEKIVEKRRRELMGERVDEDW